MLYLRSYPELLADIEVRFRDTGNARWSEAEIVACLNRALEQWDGRVSTPVTYDVTSSVTGYEVAIPRWLNNVDFEPCRYLDEYDGYVPYPAWQTRLDDDAKTMYLSFPGYQAAETVRLLFHMRNSKAPATAPTLSGNHAADATSFTLSGAVDVGELGFVKINSEYILYRVAQNITPTVLGSISRGLANTVAAAHSTGATVNWAIGVPHMALFENLRDQACAYLHEMFLNDGSQRERSKHESMVSYYQQKADGFWRRHAPRPPRWQMAPQAGTIIDTVENIYGDTRYTY